MSTEQQMLKASLQACAQRKAKLRQSIEKNQHLFPMTVQGAADLTDDPAKVRVALSTLASMSSG